MNPYIQLAKKAIETYIKEEKIISPSANLPDEFFKLRAGVFITIEKEIQGMPCDEQKRVLRGCIGTYLPTKESIAKEIISNAIAAAVKDYRFNPIKEEELPHLVYTIYVLSEPEQVKDLKELDPEIYGIIVKTIPISESKRNDKVLNGHFTPKTGLLLPDLEGIDNAEKQISIACQKAGIDSKKEKISFYRFTVKKYK